ncbi:unnamed protein product, partial [marine sediment metagenome]
VDASLEWTIFDETGLMPGATGDGPTLALPELTIAVGAWEASTDGDYIKYTAEIGSISLKNSIDYGIYDLGNGIAEAQGVLLGTELASLSLDAVYTTNTEYGLGGKYDANAFSLGAKYNSTGAYGLELVVPLTPITLTGQYAPGAAAYLIKGEYALSAGTITLQYKAVSAPEISVELADFPIVATTLLGATVTSTNGAMTITGTAETTLAEGLKFTLGAANTEGALTYFGKIGVSF